MRIFGEWRRGDDGISRPVMPAQVRGADGRLVLEYFLVDLGADATVFSAELLEKLQLPTHPPRHMGLRGLSGSAPHVLVDSNLEFKRDDGMPVRVHAEFAAITERGALDSSLLGREVLNCFDIIVSHQRNQVIFLSGNHRYEIVPP